MLRDAGRVANFLCITFLAGFSTRIQILRVEFPAGTRLFGGIFSTQERKYMSMLVEKDKTFVILEFWVLGFFLGYFFFTCDQKYKF